MLTDVTAGELMRLHAPAVALWAERMVSPAQIGDGAFEPWAALAPTLEPMLSTTVATYLAWSDANAKALAAGQSELEMQLGGQPWQQSIGGPQKYHGKALREVRRKYAEVAGDSELAGILAKCGCLAVLADAGTAKL
jgi:hypothetical protein